MLSNFASKLHESCSPRAYTEVFLEFRMLPQGHPTLPRGNPLIVQGNSLPTTWAPAVTPWRTLVVP